MARSRKKLVTSLVSGREKLHLIFDYSQKIIQFSRLIFKRTKKNKFKTRFIARRDN